MEPLKILTGAIEVVRALVGKSSDPIPPEVKAVEIPDLPPPGRGKLAAMLRRLRRRKGRQRGDTPTRRTGRE